MSVEVQSIDTNSQFKTTLPPRKRAKTKEEKEQRRVERILRNRRAAHASREKKRKHVEYLESYVVQLEQNLKLLQGNFDAVHKLLDKDQLKSVSLNTLNNLQDLKNKIHSNLTTSAKKSEGDDEDELEDDEDSIITSNVTPSPSETPVMKKRKVEELSPKAASSNHLMVKEETNTYYNYLSPVSINSPINSPMDLTLNNPANSSRRNTEVSEDLQFKSPVIKQEPSENMYDSMGQNSAAILSVHNDSYMDHSRNMLTSFALVH